jgi:tetratricopeptide repeat protein 21B
MMLAELMFLKKDTESAIFHFQQLLEKRPCYYVALETLLRLLRHVGKLAEAVRDCCLTPLPLPPAQPNRVRSAD